MRNKGAPRASLTPKVHRENLFLPAMLSGDCKAATELVLVRAQSLPLALHTSLSLSASLSCRCSFLRSLVMGFWTYWEWPHLKNLCLLHLQQPFCWVESHGLQGLRDGRGLQGPPLSPLTVSRRTTQGKVSPAVPSNGMPYLEKSHSQAWNFSALKNGTWKQSGKHRERKTVS